MNILVSEESALPNGIVKVLVRSGNKVILWPHTTPIFDLFDKYFPDLIIAAEPDITHGFIRLSNSEKFKLAVYSSKKIDGLPIGTMFFNYSESSETEVIDYAFDDTLWAESGQDPSCASEISYFGVYDESLKELLPLGLKVFDGCTQIPNQLGRVSLKNQVEVMSNSKIVVDYHKHVEPSEIPFMAYGLGCRVFTNNPRYKFAEHFVDVQDIIHKMREEESARQPVDTYVPRVKKLFDLLEIQKRVL